MAAEIGFGSCVNAACGRYIRQSNISDANYELEWGTADGSASNGTAIDAGASPRLQCMWKPS
jgi:hypothetical protein